MATLARNLTSIGDPLNWTLLFARQPEPDLEFTEEELDQTTTLRSISPPPPNRKPSGGRPILLILLLVLVGGIGYIATMEPEMLAEWLAPYLGESTPPPMVTKPKPLAPAPVAPPAATQQTTPTQSNEAPAPLAATTPSTTAVPPEAPASSPAAQTAASPAAPATPPRDPLFSEGQKVTVTADEKAPGGSIPLFADSANSKPGPVVRPGASLTIVDGDLQPGGWMYLVRTDEGATGWVMEKRLRLKF